MVDAAVRPVVGVIMVEFFADVRKLLIIVVTAAVSASVVIHGSVVNVVAPSLVIARAPDEVAPRVKYNLIRTVPAAGELHVPWK